MQGVAGQYFEAIVYKLLVLGKYGAFNDKIASVGSVVEKGVAFMLHVYPYLVGAAGFQP